MTTPSSTPGGLLAVHAHPDDETLATGGLLATWAAAGQPVTLVTCTRGERGEVIPEDLAALEGDGPALARHRERELAAALVHLGVTDHLFLDAVPDTHTGAGTHTGTGTDPVRFEDSGMAWLGVGRAGAAERVPERAFVAVRVEAAARRLARVIRDRRPQVLVTYEPGGGYGHPDHVHAHRVAMRAVGLAAVPDALGASPHAVAAVLWAAVPDDVLRAAARGLADLPAARAVRAARPSLALPDPAAPLPSVAVPADALDVRVDARPVLDRVAAALRSHVTQVGSVELGPPVPLDGHAAPAGCLAPEGCFALAGCFALSNDVLAPLLTVEGYRYAPGWPRGPVDWPADVHVEGGRRPGDRPVPPPAGSVDRTGR